MINLPKDVERLHREAMAFFDDARVARLYGDHETRLHLTRKAFAKERAAADLMVGSDDELSRSVLHRSAASLAWQRQMYDEAKALIHHGLEGNPPGFVVSELNELLEMVEAAIDDSASAPLPQHEPTTAP